MCFYAPLFAIFAQYKKKCQEKRKRKRNKNGHDINDIKFQFK